MKIVCPSNLMPHSALQCERARPIARLYFRGHCHALIQVLLDQVVPQVPRASPRWAAPPPPRKVSPVTPIWQPQEAVLVWVAPDALNHWP